MHRFSIYLVACLIVSTAAAQNRPELKDQKDKVSYSIGLDIGSALKKQNMDVSGDIIAAGLKDALTGAQPLLTEEQMKETLMTFANQMQEKQATAQKEAGEKNKVTGEKFLAENKNKPGVKTTASGLQYKVIKEGTGPTPKETDVVVTDYKGTLISGKEFDSSYKRGQSATFPVNRVIKGWTEALQLMKVGSKYELYVPASLAYGDKGAGSDIGPNETLIFEVELKDIQKGEAAAGGGSPAPAVSPAGSPAGSPPASPSPAKK